MKTITKKLFAFLLIFALVVGAMPTFAIAETDTRTEVPAGGTKVVDWSTFYNKSKSNGSTNTTVTKNSKGTGLKDYPKYVSANVLNVTDPISISNRMINLYDMTDPYFGLNGSVKENDVVLFRFICRTNPDSENTVKFRLALYGAKYKAITGDETVSEKWTEFFVPATAYQDVYKLNFALGHQLQTMDIAFFELYNYGQSVSASDLPNTKTVLGDSEYETERTVVSWDSFYSNAKCITSDKTKMQLDKHESGSTLKKYKKYESIDVKSTVINDKGNLSPSSRRLEYYDTNGSYGFKDSIASGDSLMFHLIVRSNLEEARFTLAIFGEGSTPKFDIQKVGNKWTEYYIPVSADASDYYKIDFRAGYQVGVIELACFEVIDYGSTPISDLSYKKTVLGDDEYEPSEEDAEVNIYDSISAIEKTVKSVDGTTDITAKVISGTVTHTFTNEELLNVSNGNSLVFSFVFKAEQECTPITVKIGSVEMKYFVPVQWTRLYVPITADNLTSVTLTLGEKEILLTEEKFTNYFSKPFSEMPQLGGMYLLEDFEHVALGEETLTNAGACKDLAKTGDYIVSIGNDTLAITDVSDPTKPKVTGTTTGVGKSARQVYLTEDGKYAFVTSRESGVFVVDIQDKTHPFVATAYNSIEFGNGVDISGNYAFIGNRQYGVQVVDISDPLNPENVSNIMTGEAQSAQYVNGVLYCGLWGDCRVDMYDVKNPVEPVKLGTAKLNGKGDGTAVYVDGDKTYLYAATGQHVPSGVKTSDPLTNLKLGQGNGMDIFDVTDPQNPVWLSTSKIDGRFYFQNNDYWDMEISEKNGRIYAYMVNTYNGVFVFDVTDPKAPVRVSKIDVPITFDPTASEVTESTRTIVFPYDNKTEAYSPIGAVEVSDGTMFLAGAYSDLHVFNNTDYLYETYHCETTKPIAPEGDYYAYDGSGLNNFKRFSPLGQIYRTAVSGDLIYVAAGSEGIYVLDENLNVLNNIDCESPLGICFDIKLKNGILYAAEGSDGLVAYTVDGSTLTKKWQYVSSLGPVRDVNLSTTAKFAVLSSGASTGEIISTETRKRLVYNSVGSQMYHRNTASAGGGRYLGFWGGSNTREYWYDCGENDSNDTPVLKVQYSSASAYYRGATVEYGTGVLSVASGGSIRTYDLTGSGTGQSITYTKTVSIGTNDDGVGRVGFPTVNGNLMTLCDRVAGYVYFYNIEDIDNPVLCKTLSFTGNPDFAEITDDYVLLTLGYQGLIKFDLTSILHKHCICGGTAVGVGTHTVCGDVTFTPWSNATALPDTPGYYYLTCDVNVSSQKKYQDDYYLCLNGHTVTTKTRAAIVGYDASTKDINGSLSICDCQGGGTIKPNSNYKEYTDHGGIFLVSTKGTINLYGGTIDASERTLTNEDKSRGAVISTNGTVNVYGGTIKGGTAKIGGSIYITNAKGKLNVYGGLITSGRATDVEKSGNIYANFGSANLYGGKIENGGVYSVNANITVSGDTQIYNGADISRSADGTISFENLDKNAKVKIYADKSTYGEFADSDADYVSAGSIICDSSLEAEYKDGKIYIVKAPENPISGESLTLSSDVSINFYMSLTKEQAESGVMTFKIGDRTVAGTVDKNENGYFFRCPVNSLEMATVVKAEFTLDGVTYTKQMSVDDYVQSILSGDYTEKDKALVKKVSIFGYYAQQYLQQQHKDVVIGKGGYAEMTLYPEADIDVSAAKEAVKDYAFTVSGENENIEKIERTLYLDDKIAMNFYVKVKNGYDLTDKVTVDGKDYSVTKSGTNEYKITVYDIEITDLDQDITVNADGQIITASVLSYVNAVLSKDGISENSQNAMAALYEYHKAAKEY